MDTKLTLRLNKEVIEEAKVFAAENNTSLSKLTEEFFSLLIKKESGKSEITPLVKSLSGKLKD